MSAKKDAKPAAEGAAKSGKGKLIAIVLVAVVAAAGAGGGVAWFMAGKANAAAKSEKSSKKSGKDSGEEHASEDAHEESSGEDGEEGEGKSKAKAQYLALDPAFVVNLAAPDSSRYLQVSVEVMARDAKALDDLKLHMPAVRNNLLMLFGQKTAADLSGREGREALRQLALTEVQKVMREETGEDSIDALYFTSFVTQ
jgi:flagellar FliL protein